MEIVNIQLSQLTLAQKSNLLKDSWDDLTKDEKEIESPGWHEKILKHREKALASGKASVSNWEDAKVRIRRNVSCK